MSVARQSGLEDRNQRCTFLLSNLKVYTRLILQKVWVDLQNYCSEWLKMLFESDRGFPWQSHRSGHGSQLRNSVVRGEKDEQRSRLRILKQ